MALVTIQSIGTTIPLGLYLFSVKLVPTYHQRTTSVTQPGSWHESQEEILLARRVDERYDSREEKG